jgi:hypothetical protein
MLERNKAEIQRKRERERDRERDRERERESVCRGCIFSKMRKKMFFQFSPFKVNNLFGFRQKKYLTRASSVGGSAVVEH